MSGNYYEKCIDKALELIEEIEEEGCKHPFKFVVTSWEIVETLLRAIIYAKKKTVFERPQKIIFVFTKIMENKNPGLIDAIRKLYNKRRILVHKPNKPNKNTLISAKENLCETLRYLKYLIDNNELRRQIDTLSICTKK